MSELHPDVESVLFSEGGHRPDRAAHGAPRSRATYAGRDLVLIAVLRGAVVFMGDLMRAIDAPLAIDFMAVSSYGANAKSSGIVRIVKDLDMDIKGRDVLIVEDILDSGLTLKYLIAESCQPRSRIARGGDVPLEGRRGQAGGHQSKVRGHPLPRRLCGGGTASITPERYRNLPYVGILKPEVYS